MSDPESEHWRVLVTGPVDGLEHWTDAAERAGWEAIALPLLEVHATGAEPPGEGAPPPDWIAVTSASALPWLAGAVAARPALARVPLACVGEATGRRAVELGLPEPRLPRPGAQDARGLAETLVAAATQGQRVLWPRGDRARDFGERLAEAGLVVDAPVVYRVVERPPAEPPPRADAVFFASPSAVRVWTAERRGFTPAALAIGWTTYDALEPFAERFSVRLPLALPSVEAFADALRSFFPSE